MSLIQRLKYIWKDKNQPILIKDQFKLRFEDLIKKNSLDLSKVKTGDVVSLVGNFDALTIITLIKLIEKKAIVVPLTEETSSQHEYFFKKSLSNILIKNNKIQRFKRKSNNLLNVLRKRGNPGLILFSTGVTGEPKAILHDFSYFLKRYNTPRPSFKTLSFLLFDHIGGINTLFHTLFNAGTIIAPKNRDIKYILDICRKHKIEVLPTTPTFLRMLAIGNYLRKFPKSVKIITYGTEMMDQSTLNLLCKSLPKVDFRQTYGLSEIGIVRVKSEKRNSLFMKIGGEGVKIKIEKNNLKVKSKYQMLGYLNARSPFDKDGWYNTNDIVTYKGGFIKIIGRSKDLINVGGLKFMSSDVEDIVLKFPNIFLVKVLGRKNPITGMHVELIVQPKKGAKISKKELYNYLSNKLPKHMFPRKISINKINVGHRFKKL